MYPGPCIPNRQLFFFPKPSNRETPIKSPNFEICLPQKSDNRPRQTHLAPTHSISPPPPPTRVEDDNLFVFRKTNTKTMILETDPPTYPEYDHYPVFRPFLRCSHGTKTVLPIRFDRTFISPFFMNEKMKKKRTLHVLVVPRCPSCFLQYSPAPIQQAPN